MSDDNQITGTASAELKAIVEALIFASPEPITAKMLFKLLADEPKEDIAAASKDGGVYRSQDAGKTWKRFDKVQVHGTVMSVGLHATDPASVFLSTWARSHWAEVQGGAPTEAGQREVLEDTLQQLMLATQPQARLSDDQLVELMTQLE